MGMTKKRLFVAVFGFFRPCAEGTIFFSERFIDDAWSQRWVQSNWEGAEGRSGNFEWSAGSRFVDEVEQKGLRTSEDMHYHAISSKFADHVSNKDKDLVLQFSVRHEEHKTSFCAGGYIKLLGSDFNQQTFGGDTPYKIMFGPDLCGYDVARIHLIFNWKGTNLLRKPDIPLTYDEKNEFTHLYTLVVKPDNTYKVFIDMKEKVSGSLHGSWDFPKEMLDDLTDTKPEDWVDLKTIVDPTQRKPSDWVDSRKIRDPTATIPEEWDEEEDGMWQPPIINNPKYRGEWVPQEISNSAYKGAWKPRQLHNPEYVEDVYVFDDIGAVGFELWTVNKGSIFDNILITDSFDEARQEASKVLSIIQLEMKNQKDGAAGKDDSHEDEDDGEDIVNLDL